MGRKNPEPAKENSDTGTGEADDGGGRGLGAHDDELKRRTGTGSGGEEVEQGPLERVEAVLAIVDPHHHHRLPHHRRRSLRLRSHFALFSKGPKLTEQYDGINRARVVGSKHLLPTLLSFDSTPNVPVSWSTTVGESFLAGPESSLLSPIRRQVARRKRVDKIIISFIMEDGRSVEKRSIKRQLMESIGSVGDRLQDSLQLLI